MMQRFLHPRFKELYLEQAEESINHIEHFNDLNELNSCF